jgi:hypothetical protein
VTQLAPFSEEFLRKDTHMVKMPDPQVYQNLTSLITENGKLKVVPADVYRQFPQEALSYFCLLKGYYCLPTNELIEWLKDNMGPDPVEICSGNGIIAKALGIPACENFHQDDPAVRYHYLKHGQPPVPYDYKYVKRREALSYVRKFQPDTVIAAFSTHKYDASKHDLGGNVYGVDELELLKHSRYIHIGNTLTHHQKPIQAIPHQVFKPDWLFSRSIDADCNVIEVWEAIYVCTL